MPRLSRRRHSISRYAPLQLHLDTQRFCYQMHPVGIEQRYLIRNNRSVKGGASARYQCLEAIPTRERPESDIPVDKAKRDLLASRNEDRLSRTHEVSRRLTLRFDEYGTVENVVDLMHLLKYKRPAENRVAQSVTGFDAGDCELAPALFRGDEGPSQYALEDVPRASVCPREVLSRLRAIW